MQWDKGQTACAARGICHAGHRPFAAKAKASPLLLGKAFAFVRVAR
jgi:hypothetical protein